MDIEVLTDFLIGEGYTHIKVLPGKGVCALRHFIFTTGLCIGIDKLGIEGRYCYSSYNDAKSALEQWEKDSKEGKELSKDPEDEDWIKYKGQVEYPNPKKKFN